MADQTSCPVCGKMFASGEAVIRCAACGVILHPDCWIDNGGCTTNHEDGEERPEPIAYRREPPKHAARPVPPQAREPTLPGNPKTRHDPTMSGATVRRTSHHPAPGGYGRLGEAARRSMPGRAAAPGGGIMRFWYVPVAALLAVVIAAGVIFAGDRFILGGDDDGDAPAADATGTPGAASPEAAASATAPPAEGGTPGTTPEGGSLAPGGTAVVVNTGGCLNVRSDATLSGEIITCLADGTSVSIADGPVQADGFRWYRITSDAGEGWAADDYLQPAG